ncbi:MAG: hypothetical protein ACJ8AO_07750 [Gemmatimonadaceae bacterium]
MPSKAPAVPSLAERQRPGLTETLTGPKHPLRCQSCGAEGWLDHVDERATPPARELRRWLECDEWDVLTPRAVVLCQRCSARLIEPHPRMYHDLPRYEPHPGAMGICVGCEWRTGVTCASPVAQINGGPGLRIEGPRPSVVHILCARRGGGRPGHWRREYSGPPIGCSGRAPAPEGQVEDEISYPEGWSQ